jgi:hypothetical protein
MKISFGKLHFYFDVKEDDNKEKYMNFGIDIKDNMKNEDLKSIAKDLKLGRHEVVFDLNLDLFKLKLNEDDNKNVNDN